MGGILTSGADRDFLACVNDLDCYQYLDSNGAIASTTAEKNLRCCLRTEITKNDNYPLGYANAELYGWPKVVPNYST